MSAIIAVRVTVTGRVQGVGFRYGTLQEARQRGLSGWVRNLADGSVEVVAQGPAAAVDHLVDWLAAGPRFASVTNLEVVAVEPDDGLVTFSVRF
jgi:acylphosphatase